MASILLVVVLLSVAALSGVAMAGGHDGAVDEEAPFEGESTNGRLEVVAAYVGIVAGVITILAYTGEAFDAAVAGVYWVIRAWDVFWYTDGNTDYFQRMNELAAI